MFLLLLPHAIQIAAISWADLQSVLLWKLQSSENGRCVSQDIMLPNYHFSRVLFCQNIMLPKHCDAKFSKLSFAKYQVAKSFHKWIDSFELVSLCCISGSSFVGSTKSLLKDDGSTGTITHCKRAKHQLDSVNLQEDSKNWIKSCPKLIQDDSSSWTITLGPDWYLRHVRLATVDGQNIQTPSIRYSPLTPKVQCYCNLKCVSPSGRKNTHTPNITFANTRAETLRFGGAGV